MSTVVNLANLGSAGFIIQGDNPGDFAGLAISDVHDVNGDGFDDIVIGALYNDAGGSDAGAAYVIYGRSGGFANIDLGALQAGQGFRIQGDLAGDLAGLSVSGGGDVNGDGFDDLIVAGDRIVGTFGYGDVSRTYVLFGGPTRSATLDLTNLTPSDGFVITGPAQFVEYGRSAAVTVSNAGDMNGDGFDDVVVATQYGNAAYVVFGSPHGFGSNGVVDLPHLSRTQGFVIENQAIVSASNLGDINGDGFDDIIVGTPYGQSGSQFGNAYVIYGHSGAFDAVDLTNLAPTAGFRIQGDQGRTGYSVSGAGDINGDGVNDIIIGGPNVAHDGVVTGVAYVVFGHAGGSGTVDLTNLQPAVGFVIQGDGEGDQAGFSVSGAGDVNHDGFDDVIVGAVTNDSGGADAGSAYVIFGHSGSFETIDLANLSPTAGFVIQGAGAGDVAGLRVSTAGDVNADGADDLLVSTGFGSSEGNNSGHVYVIFGTNAGANSLANNDFNGDGRSDILWRNDNGALSDWLGLGSGGFQDNASNALTNVGTDWHVAGTGDFNGDGRNDILWRNDDGRMADWLGFASGGFQDNGSTGSTFVPTSWHVAGVGDFDGDGRADILWRNDDGRIADWLGLANGGFHDNGSTGSTFVPTGWQVAAVGDFNGDHRDDILWRNDDGRLSNWLGQANGGFQDNAPNALIAVAAAWHVAGVGDFDGDGRDDILWRHDDGRIAEWFGLANGGYNDHAPNAHTSAPTSWQVAAIGDYNGDGRDDILWRNDDGRMSDWLARSGGWFFDNAANGATFVPTSWHAQPLEGILP